MKLLAVNIERAMECIFTNLFEPRRYAMAHRQGRFEVAIFETMKREKPAIISTTKKCNSRARKYNFLLLGFKES
jgi:hypothetical protein